MKIICEIIVTVQFKALRSAFIVSISVTRLLVGVCLERIIKFWIEAIGF